MNELTAKDLMIGDWVQHASDNYFKVTRIDMWGDGSTHFACGHPHLWDYNNKFSPIALTAEILEKNFTFDHYGLYFFGGDYHEVYIKECANGLWRVEADEIMSGLPTWKMFVSNLHELKHTLRLAGIDITIEL